MKNEDKFIEDMLNGFQTNKGKASCYCIKPFSYVKLVSSIITKFRNKSDDQIFVVVKNYKQRMEIINFLNANGTNVEELNIKIISVDYINLKYHYAYRLALLIGLTDEDYDKITHFVRECTFVFAIFTEMLSNETIINVRKFLPNIYTTVTGNNITMDYVYSPVEETRIAIDFTDEDRKLYEQYTDYINTTVSMFGSLEIIDKCRTGDIKNNISAAEYRNTIARNNGWDLHLDVSIDYCKRIDDLFNPNALLDRANNFYNIAKKRRDLCTDNESKLESIKKIIEENPDKQYIVVSKRGDFALKVTEYLIDNGISCGDFHDNIPNAMAVDETGKPILVKSGVNKGKPKIVCHQAISTINLKRFNAKEIKVLSIKNTSDTKLKTAIDGVIFTSPLCGSIIDFKQRFTDIVYNSIPTETYRIYFSGSIENEKITKEKPSSIIQIKDNLENSIMYDEKNNEIIL